MTGAASKSGGAEAGQDETNGESAAPKSGADGLPATSPLRNRGSPESPPTAPNVDRLSSPRPSAYSGAAGHARRANAQKESRSANPRAGEERDTPNISSAQAAKSKQVEPENKAGRSSSSSSDAEHCGTPERAGATRQTTGVGPSQSAGSQSSPCNGVARGLASGPSGSAGPAARQASEGQGPSAGPKASASAGNTTNGPKQAKRTRFGMSAATSEPEPVSWPLT